MPSVKWEARGSAGSSSGYEAFDIATRDLADWKARQSFVRLLHQHEQRRLKGENYRILNDADFVPNSFECDGFTILFSARGLKGAFVVIAFPVPPNEYWIRVESVVGKE